MTNAVYTVRNKTELNSVMKHYRPLEYSSVYDWLRKVPSVLPDHYPAVLFIEEKPGFIIEYEFRYLYATQVASLAASVQKALKKNESNRGRKMTGRRPKELFGLPRSRSWKLNKVEPPIGRTTGVTFTV